MRVPGVVLCCAALAAACGYVKTPVDPGVVCTAVAVSSLNVTVRDSTTGAAVCDAAVTALRVSERYELRRTGDCRYAGPEERDGVFEVRAARSGYEDATVPGVRVARDECHVIPVAVTVELRPAS